MPDPEAPQGPMLYIIESLMTSSHSMTFSCLYGFSDPEVALAYNRHVRVWVDAVLTNCLPDSTIRASLRRGFELMGIDNPPDGAFNLQDDFEMLQRFYFSASPFFKGGGSTSQEGSALYRRLLASDDSLDDLKSLILLFDYVGFPFEPLNLVRGPRVGEFGKHRRTCGCVYAVISYARWQTEVSIMFDVTTKHLERIREIGTATHFPDGGVDPNDLEQQVAELLVGCMRHMGLRNQAESKRLFVDAREKQLEVLDRIQDLCRDDSVDVTAITKCSSPPLRGENVFLDYGTQMVRISKFVNELFDTADRWNHWHAGASMGGVWSLIDPSNWDRIQSVSTSVGASMGVSME